jgi:hypothetical protein
MLGLAGFGLLLAMVVSQRPGQDASNRECAPEGLKAEVRLSYWPPSIFLQQRIRFRPSCIQGINSLWKLNWCSFVLNDESSPVKEENSANILLAGPWCDSLRERPVLCMYFDRRRT